MTELTNDQVALFRLLTERTRVLATVVDNAATVLSEEFESMVIGPLRNVQEVLSMIPQEGPWDGTWRLADIHIEYFSHDTQRSGTPRAVRMTHVPTGLAVEVYQHELREDNEGVARKALYDRVQRRLEAEQRTGTAGLRR